jgi:hypothetical protein
MSKQAGRKIPVCVHGPSTPHHAGLVFVQSDVRAVVDYMWETFRGFEPERLRSTTDVADIDLDNPELLLRPRECRASCDGCELGEGSRQDEAEARASRGDAWLLGNPLGLPTEREVHSVDTGKDVYRFMLQRKA